MFDERPIINRVLPAEWEPQSAIQLTWPHEDTDWNYILEDVTQCYVRIATEISKRELLLIVCKDKNVVRQRLANANQKNIIYVEMDTNDTWARDHGAITVKNFNQGMEMTNACNFDNLFGNELQVVGKDYYSVLDFCFNGWGLKFAANKDNRITRNLYNQELFNADYENCLNFVLEGGSIESDGCGTILTTSECLLSDNRNEEWSREDIESYLYERLGAVRFLWLNHGYLAGDDTDSHVDTLARLCDRNTIAYVKCDDVNDEHYAELKAMEDELKAFVTDNFEPYRLLALPMADYIEMDGERLPATYANFLIMNGAVLMPTYGSPKDEVAKKVLQKAFPDREIVGCDCVPLIRQHGSLHCITMQFPQGLFREDTLKKLREQN